MFENETVQPITGAPLFTTISQIHSYMEMSHVYDGIGETTTAHADQLEEHDNTLAIILLDNSSDTRRLKRSHFHDLIYRRNNRSGYS